MAEIPIIRIRDKGKLYDHKGHLAGYVGMNGKIYRRKAHAQRWGGGVDESQTRKEWRE